MNNETIKFAIARDWYAADKIAPQLPERKNHTDAGLDLHCVYFEEFSKNVFLYRTGLSVEIPENYYGVLVARSSTFLHYGLMLTNAVGIIDSDYRGEIKAYFRKTKDKTHGDVFQEYKQSLNVPIIQLVINKCELLQPEWALSLSETRRGDGGFGSTNPNQ
jgi:dUTP pyrophosphatase